MSRFPDFFRNVPVLRLYDPLAEFLGAERGGLLEYRYVDVVRLTGHSCPTVAGAFLSARAALRTLYGRALPVRGQIQVELRARPEDGTTGVVATVLGAITGAAGGGGFAGIGGRFVRRGLLQFGAAIDAQMRLTRLDNGCAVELDAQLQRVPGDPRLMDWLRQCLEGAADEAQQLQFQDAWQARVCALLLHHADDPNVFELRRLAPADAVAVAG